MTSQPITVGVVRVFTTEGGTHGNLLGIVDGALVPAEERQSVAAEIGYSETVFIDAPHSGQLQVFTPATELPFAGHPTVGAAWWLYRHGYAVNRLLVPAGELQIRHEGDITRVWARAAWAPEFVWHDMAMVAEVDAGWVDRWTDHVEKTYDLAGMKRLIAAINRRPDYAPTTSRIDVPATVIHGNDDRVFPLDIGRRLASLIADADYAEIEGAGHAPPMERPAPVTAAVCALVERVIDAPLPDRRRNPDSSLRLGLTQ